ncbi:MAG TPA: phage tail tip lysozyme [Solirubrobacteraceae bacterium]|nr:phage tail tip lysozyme [Solirubrobacteraceae bacterium]
MDNLLSKYKLLKFAEARHEAWYDLDLQAADIVHELEEPEYRPLLAKLRATHNTDAATKWFGEGFENPEELYQSLGKREKYAEDAYKDFG